MGMFSPETEALRQRLAQQMTHATGQSGGEWIQAKQRMNLLPPWYQTLSGERAGQGFTESLQAINQNRGDMQIGDMTINPLDFVNPIAGATVWHGSPHRFDKFDLSKIGTGEGAQAYGHGLYFADSPQVAQSYAEALNPAKWDTEARGMAARALEDSNSESAIRGLEQRKAMPHVQGNQEFQAKVDAAIDIIRQGSAGPSLYKVDLPDDQIANMLDWDAPLSQQPEAVRKAMGPLWSDPNLTGGEVYNRLARMPGFVGDVRRTENLTGGYASQNVVSRKLGELGIPGIKYFDGGSRAAGEGTRNYVVFDDSLPKILERR